MWKKPATVPRNGTGVREPNTQHWRKQKELLKGANSTQKAFCKPKHRNLNATDKVLLFVLEKLKNGHPLPAKQYE
jgi:hypothetical protein